MNISIVVPVKDEVENLAPLHSEIHAAFAGTPHAFELIFVDDGSSDGSRERISLLAQKDALVSGAFLGRNRGQGTAWQVGVSCAQNDWIAFLDADGQNTPESLVELMDALEQQDQAEVGLGQRLERRDPAARVAASRWANSLLRIVLGSRVRDLGCSLRVLPRRLALAVPVHGELHRLHSIFVEAATIAPPLQGSVAHRSRVMGRSHYGFGRILKLVPQACSALLILSLIDPRRRARSLATYASALLGHAMAIWLFGQLLPAALPALWVIGLLGQMALLLHAISEARIFARRRAAPQELRSLVECFT